MNWSITSLKTKYLLTEVLVTALKTKYQLTKLYVT